MIASWHPSGEVHLEASREMVERAHEEMLAGNLDDERLQQVRPLVRESWERSRRGQVRPAELPSLDLNDDELEAYRAHPLAPAMDMIRELLLPGGAEDSGVLIVVGDQAGRLLWIEGDRELRSVADGMGIVPGVNWSEDAVGTAGPSTALALGQPVQIRGPEHYNRLMHSWSCTAAPVRDPETQCVLGLIDISGGPEAASAHVRMLVDATVRAVESQMLVARLRSRSEASTSPVITPLAKPTRRAVLRVLGRDTARLEADTELEESVIDLSARHAAILLMLAVHRQGLSAERLTELVYGPDASPDTLRPEMVRLRKVLERHAPGLVPESRPYRLPVPLETDAHDVLSLLQRGAHRVALTAYRGPVLPESVSPGVQEFRDSVSAALRDAMLTDASLDALLAYAEIPDGQGDAAVLRLALEMLPARSPKRAGLVSRIERLEPK